MSFPRSVVAAASLLAALSVPEAHAAPLPCGAVVTQDHALSADMNCPGPGPALVIGAKGIKLDLAGHAITISGAPGTAIQHLPSQTFPGVVVRGPGVIAAPRGIYLESQVDWSIHDLTFAGNGAAVVVAYSTSVHVNQNTFTPGGVFLNNTGVSLLGAVIDSVIADNVFDAGGGGMAAIWMSGGGNAGLASGNTVERNLISGYQFGVWLSGAHDNVVTDNQLETGEAGVLAVQSNDGLAGAMRNRIQFNTLTNFMFGVRIGFSGGPGNDANIVYANQIHADPGTSINGVAVFGQADTGNRILENLFHKYPLGTHILDLGSKTEIQANLCDSTPC